MLASSISIPDSPLDPLLSDADRWGLSAEQLTKLNSIALDFRSEAVTLLSQRQLLTIVAHRKSNDPSASEPSVVDLVREIGEKTTELELARLRALNLAKEVLSVEQWSWLHDRIDVIPSFDSALGIADSTEIDGRISNALEKRLKDTKVVEIETSQAIAERVIGWSKSFAFLVGVPLAALGIVLAILGLKSYADFKQLVATAQKDVVQHLDEGKRSVTEIDSQARKVRSEYEELQRQLAGISNLTQNVRELAKKVQKLEQQISFINPAKLSRQARQNALRDVRKYQQNLAQAGYKASQELQVLIDPTADNAYFDGNKLVVSARGLQAPELIHFSYTLHALNTVHSDSSPAADAIRSGLSDFFSCSYQDNPKFGEQYVKLMSNVMPEAAKRGFLRNLSNDLRLDKVRDNPEPTAAGEAWGGAFWEIRAYLGKVPTERLLWATWQNSPNFEPDETYALRFGEALAKEVAKIGSTEKMKVIEILKRRGLPVNP